MKITFTRIMAISLAATAVLYFAAKFWFVTLPLLVIVLACRHRIRADEARDKRLAELKRKRQREEEAWKRHASTLVDEQVKTVMRYRMLGDPEALQTQEAVLEAMESYQTGCANLTKAENLT